MLARHEAAHTIVADELHCIVKRVNISSTNEKDQKMNVALPKAFMQRKARSFDIAT